MNERYDKNQKERFEHIVDLYKNKKYDAVIKEATAYLVSKPDETHVRFMRGKSYRKKEMFEEAISDFKYNVDLYDNDYSLVSLYYLYCYLNMYKEALSLIPKLCEKKCMHLKSLIISEAIIRKQLGVKPKQKPDYMNNYVTKQIENYNEEISKKHIIEKHILGEKENNSLFTENLDINYLYELVKENVSKSPKANIEEVMEVHFFAIPSIGVNNDIPCNFIKVVVIPNTNNIISFYPENNIYDAKYTILEYDRERLFKEEKPKTKTLSRVDKFNRRYNR